MITKPETVQELAAATAAILRERGRCREEYIDPDGHVCVAGACNLARGLPAAGLGLNDIDMDLSDAIQDEVTAGSGSWDVARWNDDPATADADVLRVLDHISGWPA